MKFTLTLICLFVVAATPCARADTFGSGGNTFDIAFVPIDNPGNVADTTGNPNPAGSVAYAYRIGKYEISEAMIDKANAQSAADGVALGITRITTRGPLKPETEITWFEAAKFVNWLNTSTGHFRAYKFDGSGNFQLWAPGDTGFNANNRYRNSLAFYFLPNVDEWYKAAYYNPTTATYYDFPTSSDSVPDGIDFVGDPNFDAVFADPASSGQPNDITNVGKPSPYGTAGQGGNVWEWHETSADLLNQSLTGDRIVRGISWGGTGFGPNEMKSSYRLAINPTNKYSDAGFRVASLAVPEPSAILLAVFALVALPRRRKLLSHDRVS